MLNHKKTEECKYMGRFERKGAKEKQMQIYHRVHRGHGGKNPSQRIYAGRPHKYTDSMYYLHFLHELHGENGCSLWLKQLHFRVFSCFSW